MSTTIIHVLFLTGALVLLCLPVLQRLFMFVPEHTLKGVVVTVHRPVWSLSDWLTGAWQTNFEQWWNARLGFRGALIKTVNQINFSVFNEVSSGGNVKIVLGKNNMLYEKGYIANYHGREAVPLAVLETQVARLQSLQAKLKQRGIVLLLVISPSKASVYPEYLPRVFAHKRPGTPATDYERIKPLLEKAEINLVDGTEFLLAKKKVLPDLLFPHGGTHWSYYGACVVQSEIMRTLQNSLNRPLRQLDCEPIAVDNNPIGTDRDLSELLNLWEEGAIDGPTPHPRLAVSGTAQAFQPRVAAIGDSFIWTLAGVAEPGKLYQEHDIYYYFESRRRYPAASEPHIREKINWSKDFFSKDVIIIEINEVAVSTIGYGFVEAALAELE